MPQPSYPFASARVRAKENTLIGREKVQRLLRAADAGEALALLAEFGYPVSDGMQPEDFEKAIAAALKSLYAFVDEVTPDQKVTDLFFQQFDYHNLKAILKSEYLGTGAAQRVLVNEGTMEPALMYEAVREKKYNSFPDEMRLALIELDKRFAVRPDASLIGLTLDAAYGAQIVRELESVKEPFVHEFFAVLIDFANVGAVLRLKRANVGRDVFERAFIPGGSISKDALRRAFEMTVEDAQLALARGKYAHELTAAFEYYRRTGNMTMLWKVKNDFLIRLATQHRQDMFSISPLMAFMVSKVRETEAVRMIMIAKLNGLDMKDVAELLPELN